MSDPKEEVKRYGKMIFTTRISVLSTLFESYNSIMPVGNKKGHTYLKVTSATKR